MNSDLRLHGPQRCHPAFGHLLPQGRRMVAKSFLRVFASLRTYLFVFLLALFTTFYFSSCDSRLSQANLQQKLDSIAKLENLEKLKLQGIDLEDYDPLKAFMDSLSLQTLPLSCSEDFVESLPRFTVVPDDILYYWQFDSEYPSQAILLPESLGAKLLILANTIGHGVNILWLYSLDEDNMPIDRLLLYIPQTADDIVQHIADFSITSDYTIHIREYIGDTADTREWTYIISPSRHFQKQQ